MDVTRNVGNNHIDSDKHMDLKHWKRIISTVSSINTMITRLNYQDSLLSICIDKLLRWKYSRNKSFLDLQEFKRNPKWFLKQNKGTVNWTLLPDGIIWIPYHYVK